jgi:hypothetical protein
MVYWLSNAAREEQTMTIENNELARKIAQANQYKDEMIELYQLRRENEEMKQALKDIFTVAQEAEITKLENNSTTKYFIDRNSELLYSVLYTKKRIEHFVNKKAATSTIN